MPNLYMVMLGGRHVKANTEVHDVVFVVGETLEDCYPQLKKAWFAEQKGLHIDAWMQVNGAQAESVQYQLHLNQIQRSNEHHQKLWLINLGGYDAKEFGELHRYVLVVAEREELAKQRGKLHFESHWQKQHTDRVLDVDDCISIDCIEDYRIILKEGTYAENMWENTYLTI